MTKSNRERDELIEIGMELMHEHDRPTLPHKILATGKRFTQSDAGGLFLTEPGSDPPALKLALYEFDSLPNSPPLTGRTLNIDSNTIMVQLMVDAAPYKRIIKSDWRTLWESATRTRMKHVGSVTNVTCL